MFTIVNILMYFVVVTSLAASCELAKGGSSELCQEGKGCKAPDDRTGKFATDDLEQVSWPWALSKRRKVDGGESFNPNVDTKPSQFGRVAEIQGLGSSNNFFANESESGPAKICMPYNGAKHCMHKRSAKPTLSWFDAVLECLKDGGSLSVFRDRAEHDLFITLAKKAGLELEYDKIWVNGHRVSGKSFQWLPSKVVIPANQFDSDTDEPCVTCDKFCAAIEPKRRPAWRMASNFCHSEMYYICQYKV